MKSPSLYIQPDPKSGVTLLHNTSQRDKTGEQKQKSIDVQV